MDGLGAADEAHGGGAVAKVIKPVFGRRDDFRIIRQSKIVVGAEVEAVSEVGGDVRRLRRGNGAFGLVQPSRADGVEIRRDFLTNSEHQ